MFNFTDNVPSEGEETVNNDNKVENENIQLVNADFDDTENNKQGEEAIKTESGEDGNKNFTIKDNKVIDYGKKFFIIFKFLL